MALETIGNSSNQLVIECFYYPQCSSRDVLPERLARALAEEGVQAEVFHHTMPIEEAVARGIEGSPTVMMNGADILDVVSEGGT